MGVKIPLGRTRRCSPECDEWCDDHGFCLVHNRANAEAAARWRAMTEAQQRRRLRTLKR